MNLNTIFRGPATIDPARLVLKTAPAELFGHSDPIVSQALRLDSTTADAAYVDMVLKAARTHFEMVTGLQLLNATWVCSYDQIPIRQGQFGIEYGLAPTMSRFTGTAAGREILLPRAPLASITSFKYIDQDSLTLTTWDNTGNANYQAGNVGVKTALGRLWLNEGNDWPGIASVPNAIQVEFVAGFGATPDKVPADIQMAVLALGAFWYEHRLPINDGYTPLPDHLDALISSNRLSFCA